MLAPDGEVDRFIPCGIAPTNGAFDGELFGHRRRHTGGERRASNQGWIWRLHIPRRRGADLQRLNRGAKALRRALQSLNYTRNLVRNFEAPAKIPPAQAFQSRIL